jgi:hypothetical protein
MKDSITNLRCVSCLFFVRSAAPLRLEVVSQLWRGALSRTRALRNRCFCSDTSSSAAIVECWSALPGATHALRRVKLQSQTPPALSRSRTLSSVGTLVRMQSTPLAYCAFLPRSRCSRTHSMIPTCAPLALWIQLLADTPGDVLQELTGAPATYLPPRLGLRCFWRQRPRQQQRTRINAHSP